MKQNLTFLLLAIVQFAYSHINLASDFNKVVGYVGPACVVVDDLFYLHGHFIRRLVPEEILSFKKYQNTLSLLRQLREAVSKGATLLNNGSISLPTPIIPEFCTGFDDTAEVVLDGCTVRGNHVYIGDRVIRPINLIEKQRINAILASFLSPMRSRRSTSDNSTTIESPSTTKEPTKETTIPSSTTKSQTPTTTEHPIFASKDLKEFLSNAFNVNNNVTERFLPVAQMSPLFNHLLKQGEQLFEPRNDDPRGSYYPTNQQNMAFFEGLKAQKAAAARSAINANMNTATEIPHLYVDERNMAAASQVAGGQLNPFDPLLIQLLQSLASRQQNVNEIIRQQQMVQQQLQQNKLPQVPTQQPFVLPTNAAQSIKAGETMVIGDQTYLAVQLNADPNGIPSIGLVPAQSASSTHTVTALPPMINNWMSNSQQTQHYGPNTGMPFNGYGGMPNYGQFSTHESIRYHPSSKRMGMETQVPLYINGIPLPHQICRAHLIDPFVWART